MEQGKKRIIPSIYTSDGQFSQTETRQHVLDYNEAMERALHFEEEGAHELIIMDVTTISEKRRNLMRFLKDAVKTLRIPFTFGGGIHTIKDVESMLKIGVKKVYVNSAAVRNPSLINTITSSYGPDSLLVAIDTRQTFGSWKVYLNGGKSRTEIDLLNWVEMIKVRGAQEILVSTLARTDGDQANIESIISQVRNLVDFPLLASVGARSSADFIETFNNTHVDGIVSGHFFLDETHTVPKLIADLEQAGIEVAEPVRNTIVIEEEEIDPEEGSDSILG